MSSRTEKNAHRCTGISRKEALRKGLLHDVTHIAHASFLVMPAGISHLLWQEIAGDQPFDQFDPRISCLCLSFYVSHRTKSYTRERPIRNGEAIWFNARVFGRKIPVKAIVHPGDHDELVLTLSLPEENALFPDTGPGNNGANPTPSTACESQGSVLCCSGGTEGIDIGPIARMAFIEVPIEMNFQLWRAIAGDDDFSLEDPRLLELCWVVVRMILTHTMAREEFAPYRHTIWGRAVIRDKQVPFRLVTHPDNSNARQPRMTLCLDEETAASNN